MPKHAFQKRHAAFAATLGVVLGLVVTAASPVGAQQEEPSAPSIQMDAGKIFEMTVDTQMGHPEYSWILTRDRKFINAQRARFFQTRQTVPGTYVLDVNVQDTEVNQTEYHAFNIIVNPTVDTSRPHRQIDGELKAVLTADPSNGDTITLPPEGGIVKLDMSQSVGQIGRFSLDLDTGVDSDGDGDYENDKDNALTAGEKDATPLYVYMLPKDTPRRVILTVTDPDNTQTSTAILNVSFGGAMTSSQPGTVTPPVTPPTDVYGTIEAEKHGLTVQYGTRIDQSIRGSRELLFEWDFGDHARSLLDSPTHTYLKSGIYEVNLTVVDISNAEVVLTAQQTVQVQPDQSTTPPTPGTTPAPAPTPPTTPTKVPPTTSKSAGFGSVIKVIMIVFFLIALAVAMFFVLRWLKNKTAGKLQDTLDKMENTIVENQEKKDGEKKTPGMKLKKEKKEKKEAPKEDVLPPPPGEDNLAEREKEKSDLKTGESALASAPLAGNDAPMPDWLKGTQGSTTPAPSPSEPAPAADPGQPAPLAGSDAPMPDWLKGASAQPAQQTPPPQPEAPAQNDPAAIPDWLKGTQTTPAAPATEQKPAEPAAPAPTEAVVPDWLKPASSAAPAPAPAPEPAPVQPAPPAQNEVPDWLKAAATPAQPVQQKQPAMPDEPPAPAAEAAPVPDWLKGAPAQPAQQTPAPQQPAPAQNDPAAIPDWLKGTQTTPAAPAPEQKTAETPKAPEAPAEEKPAEAPKRSVVSDLGPPQQLKDVQSGGAPTPAFVAQRKPDEQQAKPAKTQPAVTPEPPKQPAEEAPKTPATPEPPKQAPETTKQPVEPAPAPVQQQKTNDSGKGQPDKPKQQNQGGGQKQQNNQPKKQKPGGQQQGNKPKQQNQGGGTNQKQQSKPQQQQTPKQPVAKPADQKPAEPPAQQAADAPIAIIKAESISAEPPAAGGQPKAMDIPKADA